MRIIGLDPATGVSSPTGVALINTETETIEQWWVVQPKKSFTHQQKVAYIADEVRAIIFAEKPDRVFCECFVMRGRSGEMLQQLIGALMAAAGYRNEYPFKTVFNTTVKRLVGGNGAADKEQVARGVMLSLAGTDDSLEAIKTLIHEGNFDVTDAAAIALAGYIQEVNGNEVYNAKEEKPKTVKKRRVRRVKRSLRRSRSSNSKVRRNV